MKSLVGGWGMFVLLALTGCAPDSPGETLDQGSTDGAPHEAPVQAGAQADSAWTLSLTGFGPIQLGQNLDEVASALPGGLDRSLPLESCHVISPPGWPEGVSIMIVEGKVARIDVRSGTVATREGARIGTSETTVQALYPGQVAVLPHKYTSGHYLTVTPLDESAAGVRIVFETDGEKVEQYRVGTLPVVEWVEGCG